MRMAVSKSGFPKIHGNNRLWVLKGSLSILFTAFLHSICKLLKPFDLTLHKATP